MVKHHPGEWSACVVWCVALSSLLCLAYFFLVSMAMADSSNLAFQYPVSMAVLTRQFKFSLAVSCGCSVVSCVCCCKLFAVLLVCAHVEQLLAQLVLSSLLSF